MADALKLAFVLSATDRMSRVISDAVSKSSAKLTAFERNAAKVGQTMLKTGGIMAGAGVAVGAAAFGIAKSAAGYGDSVWKASQKTGMAAAEYQKLAYAARYSNVEQTELDSAMVKLNKRLVEAASGSEGAAQVFSDLGISVRDAGGNMRAPNEIMSEVAGIFAEMKDGAEKTALSTELLGKSGANLIPLLNGGAKGLKDMGDEAVRMGFVLGNEALKASEQFNDNLSRVTDSIKGMMFQIGTALIPVLDGLIRKFIAVAQKISSWARENPRLASTIATTATVLAGLLTVLGGTAVLIGAVIFTVGKFAAAWRGVSLAINAGKALFAAAQNSMLLFPIRYAALCVWQKLAAAAQWLFNTALTACPLVWIIMAVMAVVAAVYLLVKHWDKVSAFFSQLWDGIKKIFSAVWDWIKTMFLSYTPHGLIIRHWDSIAAWFAGLWDGVRGIFSSAWDGIRNFFSSLNPLEWIASIWNGVNEFFGGLPAKFFQFGCNIISGLTDGIKSLASQAWDGITGIGEGIKNRFKSFFGINSPSTLFAEYGVNITQGLTGGLEQGTPAVTSATQGLAADATRNISTGIAAAGTPPAAAGLAGGISLSYAPTINLGGGATPEAAAEFSKLLRAHRDEIVSIMRRAEEEKQRLSFN